MSHNTSCAVVRNGRVEVAVAEERLNRVKHCTGITEMGKIIPFRAIRYCCSHLGINPADVDLWVATSCRSNAVDHLREQLLGIADEKIIDVPHPGHHLAHAHSAFACSGYDEAATIVLDTNGSFIEQKGSVLRKQHYGCYSGDGNGLETVIEDWVNPGEISIGELYCIYSAALQLTPTPGPYGFDCPLSAGGKLMGLAAFDQQHLPTPDLLRMDGDHLGIGLESTVARLRELNFVEREALVDFDGRFGFELSRLVEFRRRRRSLKNSRYAELAGEAQRLLEEAVLKIAHRVYERTRKTSLCLAGGTMLNVVAATKILEETPFQQLFIQPAAGDDGTAIGAAMYGYWTHIGGRSRPYLTEAYSTLLGHPASRDEISRAIGECPGELTVAEFETDAGIVGAVVSLLLAGKIVGIFQGRSEFGPRALGNRSLLALPKQVSMRTKMNQLKGREWYRPVAPIVLERAFATYFEAPVDSSQFMTMAAACRPVTKRLAPAICHVDGSARPQSVTKESAPFLYALLVELELRGSIPVLVNSSLNLAGEPIVETPTEAIRVLSNTLQLDALVVEDRLLQTS